MKWSLGNQIAREYLEIKCGFLDLFYPRVCEVCGKSLIRGEAYLCTYCLSDFPFVDHNMSVGKDILDHFEEQMRPICFYALYYYDKYSAYKNLIYQVKYHSYQKLAFYLGKMLGERIVTDCQVDCIIPVPLHEKKMKQRGYNQALEIAKGVNEVLQVELLEQVVIRVKNNPSQTGKNVVERFQNVEDAFELLRPEKVRGKHVLLVDDVITTGATVASCLRVLAVESDVRFSLACLAKTV